MGRQWPPHQRTKEERRIVWEYMLYILPWTIIFLLLGVPSAAAFPSAQALSAPHNKQIIHLVLPCRPERWARAHAGSWLGNAAPWSAAKHRPATHPQSKSLPSSLPFQVHPRGLRGRDQRRRACTQCGLQAEARALRQTGWCAAM